MKLIVKEVKELQEQLIMIKQPAKEDSATTTTCWLEVGIEPPPGFLVGEDSRLAQVIRYTEEIWSLLSQKHSLKSLTSQNNLPIRFSDASGNHKVGRDCQVFLWVSLGSDCLGDDKVMDSLRNAELVGDKAAQPRLFIICMKYGAKRTADALTKHKELQAVPVIWLSADVLSKTGAALIAEVIIPCIHQVLQKGKADGIELKEALQQITKAKLGRKLGISPSSAGSSGEVRHTSFPYAALLKTVNKNSAVSKTVSKIRRTAPSMCVKL